MIDDTELAKKKPTTALTGVVGNVVVTKGSRRVVESVMVEAKRSPWPAF